MRQLKQLNEKNGRKSILNFEDVQMKEERNNFDKEISDPDCMGYASQNHPVSFLDIHDAEIYGYNQDNNGEDLIVLVILPGIDRNDLKVRINEGVLVISTRHSATFRRRFSCHCPIDLRIRLEEKIISDTTEANYTDGVLEIKCKLKTSSID